MFLSDETCISSNASNEAKPPSVITNTTKSDVMGRDSSSDSLMTTFTTSDNNITKFSCV